MIERNALARLVRPRLSYAALAAVVATSTLAGCGSGTPSSHSSAASSSPVSSSTTASSAPAVTPPPAAESSATLTAPGTVLRPGQTAIVEFDTVLNNGKDGPSTKLAVTIESITAGSLADFKGVSLTGVPKGSTPTYVKVRMTNLSSHAMKTDSNDPADAVGAIEGDGLDGDLILTGYFPRCPLADTPNPLGAGQSFTTCETFMEHGEATKIGYNGSDSTLDSPVIWSS
jgi:hypothetical protein